jgi:cyanophycinase
MSKPRLDPAGIDGSLVICGGGNIPKAATERFMELAGGKGAKLVIIPTARFDADQVKQDEVVSQWKDRGPASVVALHTRSREISDQRAFVAPLAKATGVWFEGGSQDRIADAYVGTAVERELSALLKRGGVIGGTSAGAAIMSRVMIAGGNPEAKTMQGLDLLPGAVIDQHFLKRNRKPRLNGVLARHPGLVGVGIDEGTALVVRGRELRVLGESTLTICLAGSKDRPPRELELRPGATSDWTMFRRAAIARTQPMFPPKVVSAPEVAGPGSLVIVGGGQMPEEIVKKFIALAGGPDALIVVLPTASPDPVPKVGEANIFTRAGARNVKVLPARKLKDVEEPNNLKVLEQARGIWFGGGRQWRFIDAYGGTKAEKLFHDVLTRGGVIGGSSAGATIQGEYLCRGSPLGPEEMMCEGYERGLEFLPGVAIDQHFTQRKRFPDMTKLMKSYPQFLGIGLDEGTALVVKGHKAVVMGRGKVHLYDRCKPVEPLKPDHESFPAGSEYDLRERRVFGK